MCDRDTMSENIGIIENRAKYIHAECIKLIKNGEGTRSVSWIMDLTSDVRSALDELRAIRDRMDRPAAALVETIPHEATHA